MCVVIDTNALASVFNINASDHHEFAPVLNWILKGDGFLIIGGSKYLKEFEGVNKYRRLITRIEQSGKVIKLDNDLVNAEEARIKSLRPENKYDDHHIVAIFCVSGCRILCTNDRRSDTLVKDRELYMCAPNPPRSKSGKAIRVPSIYRQRSHARRLLRPSAIVQIPHKCRAA